MGLRSLFANRKPQKPLQYEDGFGEPQPQEGGTRIQGSWATPNRPQIDIPDQGTPEVPPMDYSSALGALKGSGDASDVRYGLPQNDKPLIDARSEQDAEDLRYGYNPSNNLKPVDNPDIAQPQQPAIAQAVARKQNGFNLSGVQDALNSHRMHVGDEANQMRTAFSDIGQSVPGVKPLSALDYTQGAKNDISLQQAVEEKKRQRLQDQLAYMKQLESADGQNEWAAVSHKNGMVMYNKRTGEYRPMAEFNEAGKPDTSDLATHIGKVEDRNGNIRDFQYWTSKAGKAYVTGPNGELQEVTLNDIPWANENESADLELKQSQAEREANKKSLEGLSTLNLSPDVSIAFKDSPTKARVATAIKASTDVAEAWKTVNADKEFQALTTPTNNASVNAKKVYAYHLWAQKNMWMQQAVLAAQANMMNSGVMQVGERENYLAAAAGLPTDLLSNPAYKLEKGVKGTFESLMNAFFAAAATGPLAVKDMEVIQNKLTDLAKARPDLVDPAGPRKALKGITERSLRGTQQMIERESMRSRDMPTGGYSVDSYDPRIGEYFTGLANFSEPVAAADQGPNVFEPVGPDPDPTATPKPSKPSKPQNVFEPLPPVPREKAKINSNLKKKTTPKVIPATPTPAPGSTIKWSDFNKGSTK